MKPVSEVVVVLFGGGGRGRAGWWMTKRIHAKPRRSGWTARARGKSLAGVPDCRSKRRSTGPSNGTRRISSRRIVRGRHARSNQALFGADGLVIITPTGLEGAYVFDVERRRDERGFFARTFSVRSLLLKGWRAMSSKATSPGTGRKGRYAGCITR